MILEMSSEIFDSFEPADESWMSRALSLALQGRHTVTPNPAVGAVLVKAGRVLGEGWHARAGEDHAEVVALKEAGAEARGSTAYVTLEPCSHQGRTGPCADALIEAGVRRVVAAMQDPNPLVSGQGLDRLRAAGLQVTCGVREREARALNGGFISRMTRGRPRVSLKWAQSLDGKIALANGDSQWVTGPEAREDVHRLRRDACAVLTGLGTVLKDDPWLTVRHVETPRQPLAIVVSSSLRIPLDAHILRRPLQVVSTHQALIEAAKEVDALRLKGAEVIGVDATPEGRVDLRALLAYLGQQGINELLVEAGPTLVGAFLEEHLVDRVVVYTAPTLFGHGARSACQGALLDRLDAQDQFQFTASRFMGRDLKLVLEAKHWEDALCLQA